MKRAATLALLFVIAITPSCKRKPRPQIPAIPQPAAPEPLEPAVSEQETPAPAEPEPAPVVAVPEPSPEASPPEPGPESPEPTDPGPPTVEPAPPLDPPAPPLQLAPMVSSEDQRRLKQEIDASLARASRNVNLISQRDLSSDQQTRLNRIRTFAVQARSLRSSDPAAARALAHRADLLAHELESGTR